MAESNFDDGPQFAKQRRNLIVASIVLFALPHTNVESLQTLKVFGVEISVSPGYLVSLIWCVSIYCAWRYYTRWNDDGVGQSLTTSFLNTRIHFFPETPPETAKGPRDAAAVYRKNMAQTALWKQRVSWHPGGNTFVQGLHYTYKGKELLLINLKASIRWFLQTSGFSDALLPVLIFLVAALRAASVALQW